jgi:hypothetical protein
LEDLVRAPEGEVSWKTDALRPTMRVVRLTERTPARCAGE